MKATSHQIASAIIDKSLARHSWSEPNERECAQTFVTAHGGGASLRAAQGGSGESPLPTSLQSGVDDDTRRKCKDDGVTTGVLMQMPGYVGEVVLPSGKTFTSLPHKHCIGPAHCGVKPTIDGESALTAEGSISRQASAGTGLCKAFPTSGGADALDTTADRPEQSAANSRAIVLTGDRGEPGTSSNLLQETQHAPTSLRAIQGGGAITSVVEDRAQSSPTLQPVFAGILNGFRESAR